MPIAIDLNRGGITLQFLHLPPVRCPSLVLSLPRALSPGSPVRDAPRCVQVQQTPARAPRNDPKACRVSLGLCQPYNPGRRPGPPIAACTCTLQSTNPLKYLSPPRLALSMYLFLVSSRLVSFAHSPAPSRSPSPSPSHATCPSPLLQLSSMLQPVYPLCLLPRAHRSHRLSSHRKTRVSRTEVQN